MCFSVGVSVCLVCCVLVNYLVKRFTVFSVGGGALLDRPYMVFQRMCVLCCDPSVHLSVPSIGFVYVFVCRKLSPHLGV